MSYLTKAMLEEPLYEVKRFEQAAAYKTVSDYASFDIFLSHSYDDKQYIRKLKQYIEDNFKLTCYVDWLCEPTTLDRSAVTRETATILRKRLRQSKTLIFCTSKNSPNSRWMPWELGFFDAYRGFISILPITDRETDSFKGQEYLGLYPYIDKTDSILWVNGIDGGYVKISDWVAGALPKKGA